MSRSVRVAQQLGFLNLFLLSVGLFQVLMSNVAPIPADAGGPDHWRSDDRRLMIVDRTGDPAWHEATRHAVDAWNQVAGESGLLLGWTAGTGTCAADGVRISICTTSSGDLGRSSTVTRQGVARVGLALDGHHDSAFVLVCSDCETTKDRRRVIATHEIGHTLGLTHTRRPSSVMLHTGGADRPDALDGEQLRSTYRHSDGPERCGVFNLRLGGFCL